MGPGAGAGGGRGGEGPILPCLQGAAAAAEGWSASRSWPQPGHLQTPGASVSSAFSLELPSEGSPGLSRRAGSAPPQGGLAALGSGSKLPATAEGYRVAPPWFPASTGSKGGVRLVDPTPQEGPPREAISLCSWLGPLLAGPQLVLPARGWGCRWRVGVRASPGLRPNTCRLLGASFSTPFSSALPSEAAVRGWVPVGYETHRMPRRATGLKGLDPGLGPGGSSQLKAPCPLSPPGYEEGLRENNFLTSFPAPIRASISKLVHLRAALGNS